LPIDKKKYSELPFAGKIDSSEWVDFIPFRFPTSSNYILKDELAIMDVIVSNFYTRPIYFAITCQPSKLLGLNDYTEMEGLALRITPTNVKTPSRLPSIYGFGDINSDLTYNIIMDNWKWGNFDKIKTFVDKSYLPEVQAMKLVMLRDAEDLEARGESQKAIAIANKYFEAFPNMNFPYDAGIIPFIQVLIQAKDFESAKKQIKILAEQTKQYIDFYDSQTSQRVFDSFKNDYEYRLSAAQNILEMVKTINDEAFTKEINDQIQPLLKGMDTNQKQ